jgi:hypothetical protein
MNWLFALGCLARLAPIPLVYFDSEKKQADYPNYVCDGGWRTKISAGAIRAITYTGY